MITAQEVETSVTKNSLSKEYPHPDDQTTDTPGFKQFATNKLVTKNILVRFQES